MTSVEHLPQDRSTPLTQPCSEALPFARVGPLDEPDLRGSLGDYVGRPIFEGQDSARSQWVLKSAGKPGGLMSGGRLSGKYAKAGSATETEREAFLKRDNVVDAQIAEVLASRLINSILPGASTDVDLVKPIMGNASDTRGWQDIYVASYVHPYFKSLLCDAPEIESAYSGICCRGFNPLMFITPLVRGGKALERAYPSGPQFLATLQTALIANLLIANNDMHLGNLLLCYQSAERSESSMVVRAFDFGAAFNFSSGAKDDRVLYDASCRGAITTESVNHFMNFPERWTTDSEDFWKQVEGLSAFDDSVVNEAFDYLKAFYDESTLIRFMQERIFVGKSLTEFEDDHARLNRGITEFSTLMRNRVDNFKSEATRQLHMLEETPVQIRIRNRQMKSILKKILCVVGLVALYFVTKNVFKLGLP